MRLFRDNIDCKTVRILRIQVRASSQTKGLERGGRVRRERKNRVSPQSRSLFSASFHTFCLTARAYLNTQNTDCFAVYVCLDI